MGAELPRKDVLDDDLMAAPMVLTRDFEKLLGTLKLVAQEGKNVSNSLGGSGNTLPKAKEDTEKLTLAQKELLKVQNQIATAVARENEEYIAHKKVLDDVNQRLKEKTKLGERDALAINKQNASMKELEAALNKNRVAYAKLRNEEERNTKAGKDLLKVIQQQDKEFKELRKSIGQHQDEVGNYGKGMEGLDNILGGVIGRAKQAGSALLSIFANPIILGLAGIIGLFVALKSAVTTYYDSTVEGEERLKKQQATWDAFFLTLKHGWRDIGKSIDEFLGKDSLKGFFTVFLAQYAPGLLSTFLVTEQRAQKLADTISRLWKDHARDVVDDAQTELKANEQLEISRNKLKFTAEERLEALRKHNKLREDQLKGDIQLAADDLKSQQELILKLGGRIHAGKMIKDLSDEEIVQMGVKQEEIEKLAQKEAALLKVQSDASAKRIGLLKLEAALVEDIRKDDVDNATKAALAEYELTKKKVEIHVAGIQEQVHKGFLTKKEGEERVKNYTLSMQDDLINAQIEGYKKLWGYEEMTAEERLAVDEKLYQLKLDLAKAHYDQVQELPEVTFKAWEKELKFVEKLQQIYGEFINGMSALTSSFTDRRLQQIDLEEKRLDEKYEKDIARIENMRISEAASEEEKALKEAKKEDSLKRIELEREQRQKQIDKQRIEAQARQAKFDKAIAISQAIIQGTMAVLNQLYQGDPYTAIPRSLAVGAIAAGYVAQVIAIANKPIPKYEVGTTNHPGGLAIVGEKGSELIKTPSGIQLSPSSATMMNLPKGTEVIPHDESMKMLAMQGIYNVMNNDVREKQQYNFGRLEQKMENIERAIVNKKEVHVSGRITGYRSGGTRVKYIESLRNHPE